MKVRVKQGESFHTVSCLREREDKELSFELEAGAKLHITQVNFFDQDFLQHIDITFVGEGASCSIYILDLSKQSSHLETNIHVRHQVPHCKSVQVHKGLYADSSTGQLKALIEVAPQAIGTDAYQLHRSLLLSPNATTKPEPHLQIQADAVKCRHGVSVGQLDEQALFYLRTRGLDEIESKRFLIQAFAQEILDTVSCQNTREKLEHEVFSWI